MKLLERTNRTYLILSALGFIVAGALIYFILSFMLEGQLAEKMQDTKMSIIKNIEKTGIIPSNPPFIEVTEVQGNSEQKLTNSDTLILDPIENENILFRQTSGSAIVNGKTYSIVIRNTLVEKSDLLVTIVITVGVVFTLLLISLYFINRRLSLIIWQPFYATLNDLKEFSHDKPDFKLSSESEIDEFAELNKTLEKLTQEVISDYQSLKRFTEDASHEIQTPLAIIQLKLEALIQDPGLNKEQSELISTAYSSAIRISKLTQALLLLTKIVNGQFPEKKVVNISELLEERIDFLHDLINDRSLLLEKTIEPGCLKETNYFLADSMILNLLGNTVKHCNTGGKIKINLSKQQFVIANTGIPLAVNPGKIFERFYKTNKSSESLGLGLSIVKEICQVNNWRIQYQYKNDMHIFVVSF